MRDIKPIVAKNIASLRQGAGMTQLEFAEKLNYSDKAISKWERGESLPDITVLVQIAELFGVSLDLLVQEAREDMPQSAQKTTPSATVNRRLIAGIGMLGVWVVATLCFVLLDLTARALTYHWLAFVCAVPASLIVWLVFNSIWFNKHRNYLIISLLLWSVLATIFLMFFPFGLFPWQIFVLGAPAQVVILLWSHIRYRKKDTE